MAPRSKKVEKKKDSTLIDQYNNDRLIILPDNLTNCQIERAKFIDLRHPQTNEFVKFLYSVEENTLAQIRSLPFSHRTLFQKNEVIPINKIDFITPINPLFILLPYLTKSSSMFCPLDQILIDEKCPELNTVLMEISKIANLPSICDDKVTTGFKLWKLNKINMMEWLNKKVDKVIKVLMLKQINVNPNAAVSSTFKLDNNLHDLKDEYKRYAFSIISEYLPSEVQVLLQEHLGLPEKEENNKRKAENNSFIENKKFKHNESEYNETPIKVDKVDTPKLTAKDKALHKAASGTKSISSFFKKK
ncbi:ribonuclease H2 subunit B isoform X1 [Daktulosphaira vitifoliae]|uniref:ribonuclease H2 subunit B isoform X1 n=1 Tax=Daktulosphaira vitifoliae TaxID=58002 RepID=UPI0021AAF385|nr:ribonuclease H2 subunit B isoform X1 [Daktulosphaira vitifoliae]